ncbi:MAG: isochorismate synthase [Ignavibacteriales bacterium]|nr:isochorismate synthase [Ignavibacteriales bacterium]
MIINKQIFLDKGSDTYYNQFEASHLFSFSQKIDEQEYQELKKKLLSNNNFLFYWCSPSEDFSFIAYGDIYSISRKEFKNLSEFDDLLKHLPFKIVPGTKDISETSYPLFVGGIKFPSEKTGTLWEDFEFAKWSIPHILALRQGENYKIVINIFGNELNNESTWDYIENILSHKSEPEKEVIEDEGNQIRILSQKPNVDIAQWSVQVNSALKKLSPDELKKVVLARSNEIKFNTVPNIFKQLKQLELNYGNCITFAYRSGASIFFGATPESLFKLNDGFVETDALAGSIERGINDEQDRALELQLLEDSKNLAEHESVVDFIIDRLSPFTEKILFDSQPKVKKYSNIQHLYSQIRGKLKDEVAIFSLLEKLYPTPAVCGSPSNEALKIINELETFDRGLFAGTIGWFNLNGRAEFAVGIRSALLSGKILNAFAGCGIVNGSDPLSEFNESELKLKPILNLFANETIYKS